MSARRILIVEDEKAIRDMIAFGLRRAGYDVREAEDCREARARIVDVRPDLMLVDWMLPRHEWLGTHALVETRQGHGGNPRHHV